MVALSMPSGEAWDKPQMAQQGLGKPTALETCQEIGLVAFMFFFELLFSYVSFAISFYVSFANLFSIILFLIC